MPIGPDASRTQPRLRSDNRPDIVAPVNELADSIEALLAGHDHEIVRCTLLTLQHRFTEKSDGLVACRGVSRGYYGQRINR
jgi:hypothetical protein